MAGWGCFWVGILLAVPTHYVRWVGGFLTPFFDLCVFFIFGFGWEGGAPLKGSIVLMPQKDSLRLPGNDASQLNANRFLMRCN